MGREVVRPMDFSGSGSLVGVLAMLSIGFLWGLEVVQDMEEKTRRVSPSSHR
jgi:hypothetical protein